MNEYRLKGKSIPSRRNGEGVAEYRRQNSLDATRIRIRDHPFERKGAKGKYGLLLRSPYFGKQQDDVPKIGHSREALSARLRAVALLRASAKAWNGNRSFSLFPTCFIENPYPSRSFSTFSIGNLSWIVGMDVGLCGHDE